MARVLRTSAQSPWIKLACAPRMAAGRERVVDPRGVGGPPAADL